MPRLVVRTGEGDRVVDLPPTGLTIGRARDVGLMIPDLSLSRRHCEVRPAGAGWEVADLGSRNGTCLNGLPVSRVPIWAGDRIGIGDVEIVFEVEPDEVPPVFDEEQTLAVARPRRRPAGDPRADALGRLFEVTRALVGERELDAVLATVIDAAIELTRAERGFLVLLEGEDLGVPVARNIDGETVRRAAEKVSGSIVREALTTGQPVLAADAAADERFQGARSVRALGLRSVLCIPLVLEGRVTGAVYVDNRYEKGVFDEEHLRIAGILADHAAVAIDRAQLAALGREQGQALAALRAALAEAAPDQTDEALARLEAARERSFRRGQSTRRFLRYAYEGIVAASPAMIEVLRQVDRVASTDETVLILGETGTGKGLLARALHDHGRRGAAPFVVADCASVPEPLMEAEFFGHIRGAFSGAVEDHAGLFEQADGGTLFLDEVGDLPSPVQAKLLRVLQDREVRRIGAVKSKRVDVRIVAATSRDLQTLVRTGGFRDDLYYRLHVLSIRIPALRERREDIPLLIDHVLARHAKRGDEAPQMTPEARGLLATYDWPGNVRELENVVARAVVLAGDGPITAVPLRDPEASAGEVPRGPLRDVVAAAVERIEREAIEAALREADGNQTRAAERLGISRPTLASKMARYGLGS